MADLSTLDPTQPPDTQLVALGATRIRETRSSTINSFGIEHFLTGEHKIPFGGIGSRPAAGHAGRIFINTDSFVLQYDTGSAWVDVINVVPPTGMNFVLGGPTTISTSTFTSLGTINPTLVSNTRLLYMSQLIVAVTDAQINVRVLIDGTSSNPTTWFRSDLTPGTNTTIVGFGVRNLGAGAHTVVHQASGGLSVAQNVTLATLVIVPFSV